MPISDLLHAGADAIGRFGRQARSHLSFLPCIPQAAVVYSPDYCGVDKYISDRGRAQKIYNYLRYEGCLGDSQAIAPHTATISQLGRVHDFSYMSRLTETSVAERIFGQGLTEEAVRVCVDQQRIMTGGTVRAARTAVSGHYKRVINLGGGFHHAYAEGGYAFCVFNDVAVAIAHLRDHGYRGKILVIDLDLHQGDGTRAIFAHDPSVATYSVHAENWNRDPAENNWDIALGPGFSDAGYLEAIRTTLPNIVHKTQPDLVFYLAGVDVAEDDELGDWRVSHDGIFARDCFVNQVVGKRRMVCLTAGGYGANAWRHSARFFAYLMSGLKAPIASNNERLLRTLRRMSQSWAVHDLTADNDEDLLGDFFGAVKRTRLFDFYSRYGVECALEKTGVLAHIRKLGYAAPTLDFQLDHPNGQCMRLYGEEAKRTLLIECILDEKRAFGNLRVLWIEWLLLQNPNAEIPPDRPLLPGQNCQGLGCLTMIIGLLFMICDRLKFDAIGFNPAHYHICFLAKGQGYFETPEDEARFRTAQNLTAGLNIQKASRCLKDGLICEGNLFKWHPAKMLIPISEPAMKHFQNPEYQTKVEQICAAELKKYGALARNYRFNPQPPKQ